MASITLNFNHHIQDSVQVGDTIYYCNTSNQQGYNVASSHSNGYNYIEMGSCTAVNRQNNSLTCNIGDFETRPSNTDFIMFSKDNTVNASTMTGYFAEVELINDSTEHAEIYHISSEIFESSK